MPNNSRAKLLNQKYSELQKSKINTNLTEAVSLTLEDGFYIVNLDGKLTCEELSKAQALTKHGLPNCRIKRIPESRARDFVILKSVDKNGLQEYMSNVHAGAVAETSVERTTTAGNAEMVNAAKAYASIVATVNGLYAEVGASASSQVNIKVGNFTFSAKVFAEVKAGIKANRLGISASASAEVGIEDTVTYEKKLFTTESGTEVTVELSSSLKLFAKAEAFAGLGLMSGAEAFAGVGIEGKIGADFKRKKTTESSPITAGAAAIALTIKAGLTVGAKAGLDFNEIVEDGNPYIEFKHSVDVGALLVGGSYEISLKALTDLFNEAKDQLLSLTDAAVREQVIAYIKKEAAKIMKQLEFEVQDAAKKIQRGWSNTQNYGSKLIIAIERGLGHTSEAMHDEITRQVNKLNQYKATLNKIVAQFDALADSDNDHDIMAVLDEISDPNFVKKVSSFFSGNDITHKSMKKQLMLGLQRYNRRIEKLNEFLDTSYTKTIANVRNELNDLNTQVMSFKSKDIPSNFSSNGDYLVMKDKFAQIQQMLNGINEIIRQKQQLLEEVSDQNELRSLISQMNSQYKQIVMDFSSLRAILFNYVNSIPEL